jgi:hypothetical protein
MKTFLEHGLLGAHSLTQNTRKCKHIPSVSPTPLFGRKFKNRHTHGNDAQMAQVLAN